VTVSKPPSSECSNGFAFVEVLLDGKSIGSAEPELGSPYEAVTTYQFSWSPPEQGEAAEASSSWLLDPSTAASHIMSARAADFCRDGSHFTINSIQVDVLGFR
jgi:hypothetical protein